MSDTAYLVYVHVKHSQDGVRITLPPVTFDGSSDKGLRQNQFCKVMNMEKFRIALEKLCCQSFEGEIVDVWMRIEKVEVDIHEALLARGELIAPAIRRRRARGTYAFAGVLAVRVELRVSCERLAFRHGGRRG